jgi:hypothetical protein
MSEVMTVPCHHGWRDTPAERITTPCPACGGSSLFVGNGGHLTCARLDCSGPGVGREVEALKAALRSARATLLAISTHPHPTRTGRLWGESPKLREEIDHIDGALREAKPRDPLA